MLSWCMLQGEGTSSPVALRARSRDSPSPSEELPSPLTRGKRPATRSRGQGDGSGTDGTTSLPPKRLCLSSAGGLVRTNITEVFCLFLLWFFFFKWWHQTLSEGIRTVLPGYSASVSRVIWVFCLVYISVRNFVKLKTWKTNIPFFKAEVYNTNVDLLSLISGWALAQECIWPLSSAQGMVSLDLSRKGECGSWGYPFFRKRFRTLSAGLESCSGPPHAHEEELQYRRRQSSTGKTKSSNIYIS